MNSRIEEIWIPFQSRLRATQSFRDHLDHFFQRTDAVLTDSQDSIELLSTDSDKVSKSKSPITIFMLFYYPCASILLYLCKHAE